MIGHPDRRRLAIAFGGALGLLFLAGLARFAAARPALEVRFPRTAAPGAGRVNLAHFTRGPIVRASSSDSNRRHHPGYLVDGHAGAHETEKWASTYGDAEPWLEVELDGPHDVDEVALELPSAHREPPSLDLRRYRIDCFRGPGASSNVGSLEVQANIDARPRHPMVCPRTSRVRVSFVLEPNTPLDVARVYEVEVWGR